MNTFRRSCELPVPAEEVFAWHERPGAFERLAPPWEKVEVLERSGSLRDNGTVTLGLRMGPVPLRWTLRHEGFVPGRRFRDRQISGPFGSWLHTHEVVEVGPETSRLEETIDYQMPIARLGASMVERRLETLFRYRHRLTREDLALHGRLPTGRGLKIAVTGSTGMVGEALCNLLTTGGHQVLRVGRPQSSPGPYGALWDPRQGILTPEAFEGLDAVVHLAGEGIAEGRWTRAKKRRIEESRIEGTRSLVSSLLELDAPPRALVSASAVGWYGDRGDQVLDETAGPGTGFLADVCRRWEAEAARAAEGGIRCVQARLGVVLDPRDGALARMLPPFRLGLGGPLGDGSQPMSWISLDDAAGALLHLTATPGIEGPVNLTAPEPVTNAAFTRTLGRILSRPALLRVPAPALRLAVGGMADELLLAGMRVLPRRLEASGYRFRDPDPATALAWMLGRPDKAPAPAWKEPARAA